MTAPSDVEQFEAILQYLQQSRGFDFTAYKRSTLVRRVTRRMQTVNVPTYEAYFDYLQVHQEEFSELFNTILINVTSFFRDEDVWEYLRTRALPEIVSSRAPNEPFRVWTAGCASGQEAYSVAMLLGEVMGAEALKDHVKIYATDADEEALAEARAAAYTAKQVESVPAPLLEKYFDRAGSTYVFKRDYRRTVIFGKHDLVQDAPISRVDFLLCRNTLMYFNAEAQSRILARFFFSLNPGAHVLLGRAEMLFSHANMFTPVDLKRRLFRAIPKPTHRDRLVLLAQTGREVVPAPMPSQTRLRESAFEANSAAEIVVDLSGAVAAANAIARMRFGISLRDIGRPLEELEVSFRPVELRAPIERALSQRRPVVVHDVPGGQPPESRLFNVSVLPLVDEDQSVIGVRVTYDDVTQLRRLESELQHAQQELETAYEELQSTNEELETTNEELQSTVEELETTNEELQSTNEELETMNEELQSTNEELQTMNDELRSRGLALNSANAFLESVFASLRSAVIVVDSDSRVLVWNDRTAELWGLRADEAQGSDLFGLDIGLPLAEIRERVRHVLTGVQQAAEVILPATNRRGRFIQCRVSIGPLREAGKVPTGAILVMDEYALPQVDRA
ncbi:MAG TPA: CheR family methyltransferase [Vicinamibacterales bacterium]|nr:CheR family methyltransferase [Vicinamibacterales bacterium]